MERGREGGGGVNEAGQTFLRIRVGMVTREEEEEKTSGRSCVSRNSYFNHSKAKRLGRGWETFHHALS